MALIEVKVPQLSESVAEATLLHWKKKPGQAVAQDEILIEIETDKVVLEVPAPAAGVMAQIVKDDGASVTSDEVIARIDTEAQAQTSPLPVTPVADAPAAAAPAAVPAAAAAPAASAPAASAPAAAAAGIAMPSAAKLMAEQNLTAADVAGTGRGGRITKGDVLQAAAQPKPAAAPEAPAAPTALAARPAPSAAAMPTASIPALQPVDAELDLAAYTDRPEQRVPMSRLRARIAERLLQSQATNAILTTFNEVNMKPVMDLRNLYKDKFEKEHGVKLGFMSFFVKAAVHALRKFPVLNASIDGNDIVYHGYFDIGIAVGSP
ncbi:MAG: 2-oxo acid dehydrogenase subunit E2, partial [Thiomonas sp.]